MYLSHDSGGPMMKRFSNILLALGFSCLSLTSQASTTTMDDVHAGFDLGTQSSLFVANATKACGLTGKEADTLMQSQKKAGLALYGEIEPNFGSDFDHGFEGALPLVRQSLLDGTLKIDRSVCKTLNVKSPQSAN